MKVVSREEIKLKNERLLKEFKIWLIDKNYQDFTINRHFNNAKIFLNEFLLTNKKKTLSQGVDYIEEFIYDYLSDSLQYELLNNANSIKCFYNCLYDYGHISKEKYGEILVKVKDILKNLRQEKVR